MLIAWMKAMTTLRSVFRVTEDAAGVTVIEYAFVAGLISIAAVALFNQMGGFLVTTFTSVAKRHVILGRYSSSTSFFPRLTDAKAPVR